MYAIQLIWHTNRIKNTLKFVQKELHTESRFNNGKGKEMTRKIGKSSLHTSMCNYLWLVYRAIIAVHNTGLFNQLKALEFTMYVWWKSIQHPQIKHAHIVDVLAMNIYRVDHPRGCILNYVTYPTTPLKMRKQLLKIEDSLLWTMICSREK